MTGDGSEKGSERAESVFVMSKVGETSQVEE